MALSKHNKYIRVYGAYGTLKSGMGVWIEMFHELLHYRGLLWSLMVRDIMARYKQSIIGLLWPFLSPLVLVVIFVWIRSRNILPIGETDMPYAAFLFTGQMVWLLFSQGIITSANIMVAAGSMLTKINFPREVLIFSAVGQTIFEFLIRVPILLIIFAWVGFTPNITIFLIPLSLLPLLFLVIGIGFFVALFNAVARDISSALGIIMNLGMFITPVIYPPPTSWPLSFLVNTVNPVSGFVTAARDLTTVGSMTDPVSYISSVIISIFIFFIGWRLFHLVEPKIAERV